MFACGAAFAAYTVVVVPMIEPSVVRRADAGPADPAGAKPLSADAPLNRFDGLLSTLFPPEAWQVQRPKIAEDDGFVFLFRDFRQLSDGRVELKPCTLIVLPKDYNDEGTGTSVPMVVTAEEGAELQFDNDGGSQRGRFGRFVSGRLPGEVRVTRPESTPGAGDGLSLTTSNIQIDSQRIWTPHDVQFRYGASYGSGRDLVITLLPGADGGKTGSSVSGAALNGIKFVELVHLDKLHLELPKERPTTAPAPDDSSSLPRPGDRGGIFSGPADAPIEITCQGSFRMDVQERIASFDDRVEVLRVQNDGPSDQLTCQLLLIHFVRPTVVIPASPNATNNETISTPQVEVPPAGHSADVRHAVGVEETTRRGQVAPTSARPMAMDVERIVATGAPVILHAVSAGARARGERLEYNVAKRLLHLEDSHTATLEQAGLRIEAPQLQYQLADDPSRLGRAWASGPGRLTRVDDRGGQLETSWGEEFRLRPQEDLHVLSLRGGTSIQMPGFGKFVAATLHAWVRETPDAAGKLSIVPDRLLAQGQVRFDSPKLAGSTQELQAWFRAATLDEQVPPGAAERLGASGNTGGPGRSVSFLPSAPRQETRSRMNVNGDLLRIQVVQAGERSLLDQISVRGNVEVTELDPTTTGADQLKITGAELNIDDAQSSRAIIRVSGESQGLARVRARGLDLAGQEIHLNQAENRLWIDGAGSMTLPPMANRRKPRGEVLFENTRPLASGQGGGVLRDDAEKSSRPTPFTITWKGRLDFDGQNARFQRDVQARGTHRLNSGELLELVVLGGLLDVSLSHRLSFGGESPPPDLGLAQMTFGGHIYIEGQTTQFGAVTAKHRMQLHNLSLDQLSGRLHGDGPGWLSTTRLDDGQFSNAVAGPAATPTAGPPAPRPQPTGPQLVYLHVEFSRAMDGNVTAQHVEFTDQVQSIFGPVPNWETELDWRNPDSAGEKGAALRCERLAVGQMPGATPDSPAVELEATGSAVVEGQKFMARGARISYAQAKDLLLLAGDGRSDAEFFRKPSANPLKPDTVARTIMYWRRDNRIEISGGKYIDLSPYTSEMMKGTRRP
ncbi:MAG: hypothetical protein U1A77_04620 [Pirellulales bacterium]